MGLAFGLFLAAVGAIVRYGFDAELEGVNLDTIGTILIIVGVLIFLISLIFWAMDALAYEDVTHRRRRRRHLHAYDPDDGVAPRRRVVEEHVVDDDVL